MASYDVASSIHQSLDGGVRVGARGGDDTSVGQDDAQHHGMAWQILLATLYGANQHNNHGSIVR
jgi:hypothetical protein